MQQWKIPKPGSVFRRWRSGYCSAAAYLRRCPNTGINCSGAHERDRSAVADQGTICTRTGRACLGREGNANSAHSEAGRRRSSQSHSCARFNDCFELSGDLCRVPLGTVLWSGGRDAHANTLILIEEINVNIFGWFTQVKWESDVKSKAMQL
jgi:hypothetical protein